MDFLAVSLLLIVLLLLLVVILYRALIRTEMRRCECEARAEHTALQRELLIEIVKMLERQARETSMPGFNPAAVGKHRQERDAMRSRLHALDLTTTILS